MNRKRRRALEKEQRQLRRLLKKKEPVKNTVTVTDAEGNSHEYAANWIADLNTRKPKEDKEPQIPGKNCPPECKEFSEKVSKNIWHCRNELDDFIKTIKKQSVEDNSEWKWPNNWDCKYVNVRFDMRDGGFIVTSDAGKRINLDQLKWQYVHTDGSIE